MEGIEVTNTVLAVFIIGLGFILTTVFNNVFKKLREIEEQNHDIANRINEINDRIEWLIGDVDDLRD